MILKSCFLSVSKLITILLYFQCLCSVFKVHIRRPLRCFRPVYTFRPLALGTSSFSQKTVHTSGAPLFWALFFKKQEKMVGLSGLEPPTSRLSGVRSNLLSYKPAF